MYSKNVRFMNWCKLVDNGEPTPYNGSKGKRLSLLNLDNLILCYLVINMSNILIIKHGSLGDISQASGAIQDISENHKI